MTRVSLHDLTVTYPGAAQPALDRLSLDIRSGDLVALLGPSGCGKTTAMKLVAGLLTPTSGDVRFDGQSILAAPPEARGAAMVFQQPLLFPHLTVAQNVGFGLRMRGQDAGLTQSAVADMLERVQLPGFGHRRPSELSGGQQQRTALARALVIRPRVLLLDEPLSNLDAHLRAEMRDLIRGLHRETGITTILVTHDLEEAVSLADTIGLILGGRLRQFGAAQGFYTRPADQAVARFFGGQNFLPGMAADGRFIGAIGALLLPPDARPGPGTLTFRPENVVPGDGPNPLDGTVTDSTFLGTRVRLRLRIGGAAVEMTGNPGQLQHLRAGDSLRISLPPDALWMLND